MKQVIEKSRCSGCTACMTICPKNAIEMIEDANGFKYPAINQNKCINCGICKKTCPILNTSSNESITICYVGYNKNEESLLNKASSGSIFELLANFVLEQNGIVIGAAFDVNNKLNHIAIEKKEDLLQLKGSKYLQSNLGNIFKYIKEKIMDRKILFVGTPCQVAGIKSIVKNDNLICIDFICHGVPTPKLFKKYIQELENKYNDEVINYNFRDKNTGWNSYSNTIYFKKSTVSELQINNNYMRLFLSDVALRESCYRCNFKLGNKYSDITLGDFWGVKQYYPEMFNKKGVSAIIINTENGKNIFDKIKNNLEYKNCRLEEIIAGNPSLKVSTKKPNTRDKFFDDMEISSINTLTKKYCKKISLKSKLKNIIKKILKFNK